MKFEAKITVWIDDRRGEATQERMGQIQLNICRAAEKALNAFNTQVTRVDIRPVD